MSRIIFLSSPLAMFKFELGKSYLGLFAIYIGLFLGAFPLSALVTGRPNWGILIMPIFIAGMLVCELRSGVALDSWWRASHPRGTGTYQALVAWHSFAVVLFSVFSYFFIFLG
jgi:hypothetical protein